MESWEHLAKQLELFGSTWRERTRSIMVALTPMTSSLVTRLFASNEVQTVQELLERECAENLPLIHAPSPERLERIRFAVLKASQGDPGRLPDMISLAQQDWRDVLVAADFAESENAHHEWAMRVLSTD
jgi:hypothetical protein